MTKKLSLNETLIRSQRVYTPNEIASLLNSSVNTIRNWIKEGMKVLKGTKMPYLICGSDVIEFIRMKKKKRKIPINPGEFLCLRCHKSRKSVPELTIPRLSGKKMGFSQQIIIEGICVICGCRMYYFTTLKQFPKLSKEGMSFKEGSNILYTKWLPS